MTANAGLMALVLLVPVILGTSSRPALAHGGEVVYTGTFEGLYVEVTDRVVPTQQGGEGLLYTVMLREVSTGLPVDGADVSVVASAGSTTVGPRRATYFGNQYQVLIPDPGISMWDVRTTVRSDSGAIAFEHQIAGSAPNRTANRVALALGGIGGVALVAVWIRRRPRASDTPLSTTHPED
jgi:hypothetical protein